MARRYDQRSDLLALAAWALGLACRADPELRPMLVALLSA
jgi:hypothetical protein